MQGPSVPKARSTGICQECKRLKIRCSRTVPCDQCVRRGVEEICPDGKLTTGRTGRYMLASSERLHEENKSLKLRIRELEAALAQSSQHPQDTHPLLEPRLLSIARPYLSQEEDAPRIAASTEEPSLSKLGTMQLEQGKERWLGATALSEVHLKIHDKDDDFEPEIEEHAKFAVPYSLLFPPKLFLSMTLDNLPPKEEAWSLLETYYEHGVYAYQINTRSDFIKRVFTPAYSNDLTKISTMRIASLYSMLALGALVDLSRPIYCAESREYMEISQSLMMNSFGDWQTSLDAIESVMLLCCIFPSRPELDLSKTYYQLSWSMKMAQSIGLHRDPAEMGLDKEMSARRRRLFVDLRLMDATESLLYGRPFTLSKRYIAPGAIGLENDLGDDVQWKKRMADLMEEIADLFMLTDSPTNYSLILKLDRRLRSLRPEDFEQDPSPDTEIKDVLSGFMRSIWYYSTLLTLHKTHFAFAAVKVASGDHQGGKFAPSVVTCFEAATNIMQAAIRFSRQHPQMLDRLGWVWPYLFTAMVVLYSFGVHMPRWVKTVDALNLADDAITQVYSLSVECKRAKETLPYIIKLRERSRTSFANRTKLIQPIVKEEEVIPGLSNKLDVQTEDTAPIDYPIRLDQDRGINYARKGSRGMALVHAQAMLAAGNNGGTSVGDLLGGLSGQYFGLNIPQIPGEVAPFAENQLNLPVPPLQGPGSDTGSSTGFDTTLEDLMNWTFNPNLEINEHPSGHGSPFGATNSTPEQIPQEILQSSWADFLLGL